MNASLVKAIFERDTEFLHDDRLVNLREWKVNEVSYPVIDISFYQTDRLPFRMRCYCENWDSEPISFMLHEENGMFLLKAPTGTNVINKVFHPRTRRPFICIPGSREYHSHPNHKNDHWENYKRNPNNNIGGLLTQIWKAWRKTNDAT